MANIINQRRVLLLNSGNQPLGVITIRQAVSLLLRETAHGVDGVAAVLRRPANKTFSVPSILRLKHYQNVPHRTWTWTRYRILKRDHYRCIYCGKQMGDYRQGERLTKRDFTVDHLIPVSRGGKNTWGNTACSCYWCNHRKADRRPEEAGMNLLWEPKTPRTNYWVASGDIPEEWRVYIEHS